MTEILCRSTEYEDCDFNTNKICTRKQIVIIMRPDNAPECQSVRKQLQFKKLPVNKEKRINLQCCECNAEAIYVKVEGNGGLFCATHKESYK